MADQWNPQDLQQMRAPQPQGGPQPDTQNAIQRFLSGLQEGWQNLGPNIMQARGAEANAFGELGAGMMRQADEFFSRPSTMSWLSPIEGPTRAVGAAVQGGGLREMLDAAASTDWQMDEEGRYRNTAPMVSEALIERGVHPILAMMAEFLVPDPTGAKKVTDLIPMFALLGPAGIRMLSASTSGGKQLGFMPASILQEAAGNLPRRSAAQQTDFFRLLDQPGGTQEAVIVIFDPNTGRWKVGDGNHRVLAAVQADSPVPVRIMKGVVGENEGLTLPPGWETPPRPRDQSAPTTLAEAERARYGWDYVEHPSEIGLPTYDYESIARYAELRAKGHNISQPEVNEMIETLFNMYDQAAQGHYEQAGRVISRAPEAVPDHLPTLQRFAEASAPGEGVEQFVERAIQTMGEDGAMRFLGEGTGLTEPELKSTLAGMVRTHDTADELTGLKAFREGFTGAADEAELAIRTATELGIDGPGMEWVPDFLVGTNNSMEMESYANFIRDIENVLSPVVTPTSTPMPKEALMNTLDAVSDMRRGFQNAYPDGGMREPHLAFMRYLDEAEARVARIVDERPDIDPVLDPAMPNRGEVWRASRESTPWGEYSTHQDANLDFHRTADQGHFADVQAQQAQQEFDHLAASGSRVARSDEAGRPIAKWKEQYSEALDLVGTDTAYAEEARGRGFFPAPLSPEGDPLPVPQEVRRRLNDAMTDFLLRDDGAESLIAEAAEMIQLFDAGIGKADTVRQANSVIEDLLDGMALLMARYGTRGNMPSYGERIYQQLERARWDLFDRLP